MNRKMSTEVAKLSPSLADVLMNSRDDHYEDMAVMRRLADQIIEALPLLPRTEGMTSAAAGFAFVAEPDRVIDFTMPVLDGVTGPIGEGV